MTSFHSERVVSSKEIFQGKLLRLRIDQITLAHGEIKQREIVEHPGAVGIVPLTDEEGRRKVILVRQYRRAVDESLWEIPAGTLEEGEEPLECAKRELLEETGFEASRWKKLSEFYTSPGFTDEKLIIFIAAGVRHTDQERKEEEAIEVKRFSLDEALEMLKRGEIRDAKTIIGLSLALLPSGNSTIA